MINGNATLSIWYNITEKEKDNYNEWHVIEHMPERTAIEGFVKGRRFESVSKKPLLRYFNLYEATNIEIFRSEQYKARLNNPTAWTNTTQKHFNNFVRYASTLEHQEGIGDSPFLVTVRFEAESPEIISVLTAFKKEILQKTGLTNFAILTPDHKITEYKTAEHDKRPEVGDYSNENVVVFIEAYDELSARKAQQALDGFAESVQGLKIIHSDTYFTNHTIYDFHNDGPAFNQELFHTRFTNSVGQNL